jgi:hypothetical protein
LAKLPVVSVFLQRIGMQIGIDESDWAIYTLITGDGNSNALVATAITTTTVVTYYDMCNLFLAFPQGYEMNVITCLDPLLLQILNLNEFKDPYAGFRFQATGQLINPLGAQLVRWNSAAAFYNGGTAVADYVVGIDKRYALEEVYEMDLTTEVDKLIDKQLERTAITKWSGFVKLDANAAQALNVTT